MFPTEIYCLIIDTNPSVWSEMRQLSKWFKEYIDSRIQTASAETLIHAGLAGTGIVEKFKDPNFFDHHLAFVPHVLRKMVFEETAPRTSEDHAANITFGMFRQALRDRPLTAMQFSCARMWLAFSEFAHTSTFGTEYFADTFGQIATYNLYVRFRPVWLNGGRPKGTAASEVTHREVRMLATVAAARGDIHIFKQAVSSGILTPNKYNMTMFVNALAVGSVYSNSASINNLARCLSGNSQPEISDIGYDPAVDNGFLAEMIPVLESADHEPDFISELYKLVE